MKYFYISIFCVALINISSFAQSGTIKGKVKTNDSEPAPYVNVFLKDSKDGVFTELDGSYTIKHIKAGNYIIVSSFVGHTQQERPVSVKAGQTTEVDFTLQEDAKQLAEVEIVGSRSLNERTTTIGKVNIDPMDLPQSIVVLDQVVFERQQSLNLGDVLINTNGVYVMGASGGTQQEIAGRGFAFGSNNTFKNGVRFNNGIMPEISSAERIEVIKGSGAILFGQVGAGGVLNIITKKPKFEQGGEVALRIGSYDFYKPSIDVYGKINNNNNVAYRVHASYENGRSFRDNVKSERIYFNPSFLIKAGKKTEILVEGDYLKDNRTLDFGTAAIKYEIVDLPRNTFLNTSWAYYNGEQKSTTVTVKHQLNSNWKIAGIVAYQGYNQDQYGTTRPNGSENFVNSDGQWIRGLQRSGIIQQYYIGQIDLTGKFSTGSIEHTLLMGADIDKYLNKTNVYAYTNAAGKNVYDTINVFSPNIEQQRHDIPDIQRTKVTLNPINRVGVYLQDLVSITENIKALVGLRYSYIDSKSTTYMNDGTNDPTLKNFPDAFSPRLGLVYQPTKSMSMFASYSNSFELNSGVDINNNSLPPSFLDQFEVGIKNELFKGLLSANVTCYQIVNSDFAQTIPGTVFKELAGEVTSKGFEVDLMSKSYYGFSIISGYSYNDTRYTKSNVYKDNSRLRYNPQHTANMSIYYAFTQNELLKGFNVGFTTFYVGERVAGRSTRLNVKDDSYKLMAIPNYFQFDLSTGYTRNNFSVRVKLSNLLNQLSYNVHDDNSVNPIAPRQFSTTVAYKF